MVMMREAPSLRVRPRLEIGDRAAQQPVVVVCFVERDKVLDGVDEVAEQRELLPPRKLSGPGCLRSSQSTRGVSFGLSRFPEQNRPVDDPVRRTEGCWASGQAMISRF